MALIVTPLDIGSGVHADHWTINVTASNVSTAAVIRTAETGARHGINQISIVDLGSATQWFELLDGDDVMIGPLVLASGAQWSHRFDKTIYATVGNALKIKTQSAIGIHLLIEGVTDAYPAQASNPSPADEATGVSTNPTLSWDAEGAESCDIYLGTDATDVLNANSASDEYKTTQAGQTYAASGLSVSTTYYWRIDVYDGATAKGNVWSFTTGAS